MIILQTRSRNLFPDLTGAEWDGDNPLGNGDKNRSVLGGPQLRNGIIFYLFFGFGFLPVWLLFHTATSCTPLARKKNAVNGKR